MEMVSNEQLDAKKWIGALAYKRPLKKGPGSPLQSRETAIPAPNHS